MVYPVDYADVRQWSKTNGHRFATAIALHCPHCGDKVTVFFGDPNHDQKRDTFASTGACPSCKGKVHSWTFNARACANGSESCQVAVYPAPRTPRAPVDGSDQIPEPIATQYQRTVDAYNHGSWLEVGVRARRTLEALANHIVPEPAREKVLVRNLQKLPKHTDLTKPITDVTDALRVGGNFSAHFQGEAEPNEETADAIVELVEFMLEYLFVVPGRTEDLANHIAELQKSEQAT